MKKIETLLCIALTLFNLPLFAETMAPRLATPLSEKTSSLAKSTLTMAQDTAITTYIYAKLATHPDLSNTHIDISTHQGKVILNGIVNNQTQAQTLTQLATTTVGVKSVDASNIIVSQQSSTIPIKPKTELPPPTLAENTLLTETHPNALDPILAQTQNHTVSVNHRQHHQKWLPSKVKKHKAQHSHQHSRKNHSYHFPKHHKFAKSHHPKSLKHTKTLVKTPKPRYSKKPQKQMIARSKESIDQMTASYLKTALMANKPVPEE